MFFKHKQLYLSCKQTFFFNYQLSWGNNFLLMFYINPYTSNINIYQSKNYTFLRSVWKNKIKCEKKGLKNILAIENLYSEPKSYITLIVINTFQKNLLCSPLKEFSFIFWFTLDSPLETFLYGKMKFCNCVICYWVKYKNLW